MITSIELKNFKSFREAKIDLERFTVFVGANASGKTSVLEAVEIISEIFGSSVIDGPRGELSPQRASHAFSKSRSCDWLYTRGGSGSLEVTCKFQAGVCFTTEGFGREEYIAQHPEDMDIVDWAHTIAVSQSGNDVLLARDALAGTRLLQLRSSQLKKPSYSDQSPPQMDSGGGGIASVLAYMRGRDPDRFDWLLAEFRQLMPRVTRIRFDKAPVQREEVEFVRIGDDTIERHAKREYQGDVILFDFENAPNVAAHAASEGTLILLGLLTVILGPNRPKILLLDDIEHGLHPLAQKNLIETIGKLLEQFPDLQILATAHSPYLLDYLQPEQVRLLALDDQGHSVCGKLTDHPQFEKWKDEMAPGEMWSMFGEKWLTEGAAKS